MTEQQNPVLVITRGIPASGKTTWARDWVAVDPFHRTRINRDDMRVMMFGKEILDHHGEKKVTVAQHAAVEAALRAGMSVVVDDTNLRLKYAKQWQTIARRADADFHVENFIEVSLDVCIERDIARGARGERAVGENVVRDFHLRYIHGGVEPLPPFEETQTRQYEPDEDLPPAWMVDIDGTLARMNGRGPFEWHRVGEDELVEGVALMVDAIRSPHEHGNKIVVVSGRDAICRSQTEEWLNRHGVVYDDLFMRAEGDNRKDSIVKNEIFWRDIAPKYRVLGVLDDRDQVVDMWRSMGLFCAQVARGDF